MILKRKITLTLKKTVILHFSDISYFSEKISSKLDDLLGDIYISSLSSTPKETSQSL